MKTREFYIAGVQFHESDKCIQYLKVGTELRLVPDPTNKYDSNAVEIISQLIGVTEKDFMLGFVPAKISAEISAAMEINDVVCKITEVTPSAKAWERIKVIIREPHFPKDRNVQS